MLKKLINNFGGGRKTFLITSLVISIISANVFAIAQESNSEIVLTKSHGVVQYNQGEKEVLIDSSDIQNIAYVTNTLNDEVSALKANLSGLLPDTEDGSVSNIVSLIISGNATSDDVLEGVTFTSSSGINKEGTIKTKNDIEITSSLFNSSYDSISETISVGIDNGYYKDKSISVDLHDHNDAIYKKAYAEGKLKGYSDGYAEGQASIVNPEVEISYTYHKHTGSSSGSGCYTTPIYKAHNHSGNSASGGGCYGTVNYHKHSGNSTSGGGCYGDKKSKVTYDSGCTAVKCTGRMTATYAGMNDNGSLQTHCKCNVCGLPWLNGYDEGRAFWGWDALNSYNWNPDKCSRVTGYTCPGHTTYYYEVNCGKTENVTADSYSLNCGKTVGTRYSSDGIDYYDLGCGKTTSTIESATIVFK